MKREERQKLVENIVKHQCIQSKQQVIDIIDARFGIHFSQTTISNDFTQLNIHKLPAQNMPAHYQVIHKNNAKYLKMLKKLYAHEINHISIINHCILIQSSPGFGQTVNFYIDALEINDIIGTVSGNDTTMIMTQSNDIAHRVVNKLFPDHPL